MIPQRRLAAETIPFAYDAMEVRDHGDTFALKANAVLPYSGASIIYTLPLLLLTDPRIQVRPTAELLAEDVPFIYPIEIGGWYFFHNKPLSVAQAWLDSLSEPLLEAARRGKAIIFFSYGIEGELLDFPTPDGKAWVYDIIQHLITAKGLPPESVYLTHSNFAENDFFAWLTARNLIPAEAFRYRPCSNFPDLFGQIFRLNARGYDIDFSRMQFANYEDAACEYRLSPLSAPLWEKYAHIGTVRRQLSSGSLRSKVYMSFNNVPRLHRQLLVSVLAMVDGGLERGLVSFPKVPFEANNLPTTPTFSPSLKKAWETLHARLPLRADVGDPQEVSRTVHNGAASLLLLGDAAPYRQSYINLTNETHFFTPRTMCFCSEKSFKPIANLQPFLIAGCWKNLYELRQMGFRTFPKFFEEGYDNEPEPLQRFEKLARQYMRVATMSLDDAHSIFTAALDDVEFNQDRLFTNRFAFSRLIGEFQEILHGF